MPAETHIAQSIAGKGDIGDAGGFGGRWSNGKLLRDGKVDGEIGSASPLAMGVAPFPQVFFNTSCFCFSLKHLSFPPLSDYLLHTILTFSSQHASVYLPLASPAMHGHHSSGLASTSDAGERDQDLRSIQSSYRLGSNGWQLHLPNVPG